MEETARWITAKIEAIHKLTMITADYVRRERPKIYTLELIHLIMERPYCRIHNLVEAKIAERQAASRYLKQFVEIGVLEERSFGREKLFIHPRLLKF